MIRRLSGFRRTIRRERLKKLIAEKDAARHKALRASDAPSQGSRDDSSQSALACQSSNDNWTSASREISD